MSGNGQQCRYTIEDAFTAASAAGVKLDQLEVNTTFAGKARLSGTCLECGKAAEGTIRQMRVGSFPCACPHKNLRLWGDPQTTSAETWGTACDACGISTEHKFRAFDNQAFVQLKQRGLIDEIASHSKLLQISRKTRWKTMPLEKLEAYITSHTFISDAVDAAVKTYKIRTGDSSLNDLLSRYPGLKRVKRKNIDPSELQLKEMARRIKHLASNGDIRTLKGFESADPLGPYLYGRRARRIKVRGTQGVLAVLSRWALLTGLLPDEQPFNRDPEGKIEDVHYVNAFSAMIRDAIRRQRLLGKNIVCIGDLWSISGSGLARRLTASLKQRFPDSVNRARIRCEITTRAGLSVPLRDYNGYSLDDAVRESNQDKIASFGQLRQKKWGLYRWLSRQALIKDYIKQMDFGPVWRDAIAGDPYMSSFEAITAGILHNLKLPFETQTGIIEERAYRSDFYIFAPFDRHTEVWGVSEDGKSTHRFADIYRSKRKEKGLVYAELLRSGQPGPINIESEFYWRNEDWTAFARYAHNVLVEELGLPFQLTEDQIKEACHITQFNVHMTLDEAVDKACSILGAGAKTPMETIYPLFAVTAFVFSKQTVRSLRNSDNEVKHLLSNISISHHGCTVSRMINYETHRAFFSFTRYGGPLPALLEALRYREQELPRSFPVSIQPYQSGIRDT